MKWPFRFRSANRDIYSDSAYGGYSGVIPRLDERHRKRKTIEQSLRENPLAVGPAWQLAFRLGALPIKAYRIDETTGEKDDANDHEGYKLLRKPNRVLTRTQMIGGTVLQMLVYEAAAWLKARPAGGGPPKELWPMSPGTFRVKASKRGLIEDFELRVDGKNWETVPFEDVCYFRLLPDPTDWSGGFSPFRSLGSVADLGGTAIDAATDFFAQGHMGSKYIKTQQRLSGEARDNFQAAMEAQRKKRWLWPLMEEDFEIKDMGESPSDEVLIKTMDNVHKVIMQTLGLPLDGDLKRLYAEAVQPIADAIEQELERSLFSEWPDDPAFPEFGFREILKGSPLERAQLHQTMILSGQETPNEARQAENKNAKEGGDQLHIPLNLVPVGESPTDGEPRLKDTAGGLGGDEGKGTIPPAAKLAPVRSLGARLRERVVSRHSGTLTSKIDRVLDKERGTVENMTDAPSMTELEKVLKRSDAGLVKILRGMMLETAQYAWAEAFQNKGDLPEEVETQIAERAASVVAEFGEYRRNVVAWAVGGKLAGDGYDIRSAYERFIVRSPIIARTETAFAFDLAGTQDIQGVQSGA